MISLSVRSLNSFSEEDTQSSSFLSLTVELFTTLSLTEARSYSSRLLKIKGFI
uniref:Uncharacterized protein n=1 Tax=Utricularia reniformis TaxID=192314 RepID=A0A1Y0B1W2_9LAMI|nr:hypothetical protein AEK19_MT1177 [Utricularia reniformis]ART31390.1 hypothetical protein AEK19_MT1177 [Utricularia reniformis]